MSWRVPLTQLEIPETRGAGGARLPALGLAHHGAAHRRVRAALRGLRRLTVRRRGVQRHRRAASRVPGRGSRSRRRGDRCGHDLRVHRLDGADDRREAGALRCGGHRRLQHRRRRGRAAHHAEDEGHHRGALLWLPGTGRAPARDLRRARPGPDRGRGTGRGRPRGRRRQAHRHRSATSRASACSARTSFPWARAASSRRPTRTWAPECGR